MKTILLHTCCAPCLAYPQSFFKEENKYTPLAFFYNPNISPEEEYQKRLDNFVEFCDITNTKYIIGNYDTEEWREFVKDFKDAPEGGLRCSLCFTFRLKKTFEYASKNNISYITSTLTVSPYKNSERIFSIVDDLQKLYPNIEYIKYNFKKKEGYKKGNIIYKKYDLYRQNYCGCDL